MCHRDLKPDNILIDAEGHLGITDFGLAVEIDPTNEDCPNRRWGQCGTYGYRALEVICDTVCGTYSDIYALGILTYFLCYGKVPWPKTRYVFKGHPLVFSELSSTGCPIPPELADVIVCMIEFDYRKRATIPQIKEHVFFKGFDWQQCAQKRLQPPFIPKVDMEQFRTDNKYDLALSVNSTVITQQQQDKFIGFDWIPGEPIKLFEQPNSRAESQRNSPKQIRTPEYVKRALDATSNHRIPRHHSLASYMGADSPCSASPDRESLARPLVGTNPLPEDPPFCRSSSSNSLVSEGPSAPSSAPACDPALGSALGSGPTPAPCTGVAPFSSAVGYDTDAIADTTHHDNSGVSLTDFRQMNLNRKHFRGNNAFAFSPSVPQRRMKHANIQDHLKASGLRSEEKDHDHHKQGPSKRSKQISATDADREM